VVRPIVLAVEGPSGVGKSTVVARLAAAGDWVPLAEAFDRIDPPVDLRFGSATELATLERRLLDEEARRFQAARSWVARGRSVVADTGFLGPLTYTRGLVDLGRAPPGVVRALVARARALAARGSWGLPDRVVYLTISERTRRSRVLRDARRHPADLDSRHAAVAGAERTFYLEEWSDVRPGRVRATSGAGAPASVADRVARLARSPVPPPPGRRETERLLERFGGSATVKNTTGRPLDPRR